MTYLEVLDTAIKIGLGAVIAGVSGYFLARNAQRHELGRDRHRRKLAMLERAADRSETWFFAWHRYLWLLGMMLRKAEGRLDQLDAADLRKLTREREDDALAAFEDLAFVLARLRLLRADDLADKLKSIYRELSELHSSLVLEKQVPSREALDRVFEMLLEERRLFSKTLGEVYDSITG